MSKNDLIIKGDVDERVRRALGERLNRIAAVVSEDPNVKREAKMSRKRERKARKSQCKALTRILTAVVVELEDLVGKADAVDIVHKTLDDVYYIN